ncbi:hypothetical protein [Haloactinomyces albus]|uniref:Uncharacterized protein n=1 Tax=Haloactinomyces albus TaxID=1352928 RepID=A0AAE3ZC69_9ACTN|nr:hypothetical protein [Haloactinomyces albus]MDR7302238.1 hypothetical protein [Haloactinomyces albus]
MALYRSTAVGIDHDLPERRTYRQRLAAGSGYGDEHRILLHELLNRQAEQRNRDGAD